MRLTEDQSRELLKKYGICANEVCDACGKILGHVRFTRKGQLGEWCARLCRDGVAEAQHYTATRKGGRPTKYRTDRERRAAERQQHAIRQHNYRERLSVTQNPLVSDSFHASTEAEKRPLAMGIA